MSENNFTETTTTNETSEAIYSLKEIMRLNEKINELEKRQIKDEIIKKSLGKLSLKIESYIHEHGEQTGYMQEIIAYNYYLREIFLDGVN